MRLSINSKKKTTLDNETVDLNAGAPTYKVQRRIRTMCECEKTQNMTTAKTATPMLMTVAMIQVIAVAVTESCLRQKMNN